MYIQRVTNVNDMDLSKLRKITAENLVSAVRWKFVLEALTVSTVVLIVVVVVVVRRRKKKEEET